MCEASAPASSANLGPGFDTLALAVDLRCNVAAAPSDAWTIRHVGPHTPEEGDAVLAAARSVVGQPLALTVQNDIPIGRGLGSSAAAAAAAAAAALKASGRTATLKDVFEIVSALEGHPDNAAATVYGGLVSVTVDGDVISLDLDPRIVLVLAVPDAVLSTSEARRVLPQKVDRAVAVRSLQRLVVLVEGLRSADGKLLAAAAGDELHEHPRASLNPRAERLIAAALNAGAMHACWSGAGPSVLALTVADHSSAVEAAMRNELAGRGTISTPQVATEGLLY
jgi:homoserine kinase